MRECTVCDEDISHRHGNAKYCRECSKEVLKIQCKQKNTKYSQTAKGKAASAKSSRKYNKTLAGKATSKRYYRNRIERNKNA